MTGTPAQRFTPLTDLIRRFRGLGIALVVLAMSAGVVFAAAPLASPPSDTRPNAETPTSGADEDESEAPETEAPETEAPDTEAPDTEDPSEDADTDKAEADSAVGGHPRRARVGRGPDADPRRLPQPRRLRLVRRPHEGRDPRHDRLDDGHARGVRRREAGQGARSREAGREGRREGRAGRRQGRACRGAGTPRRPRDRPPRATDPGRSPAESGSRRLRRRLLRVCEGGPGPSGPSSPVRTTAIAFSSRSFAIVRYLARFARSVGPIASRTSWLRMTPSSSSTASLSCCLAATRLSSAMGIPTRSRPSQPLGRPRPALARPRPPAPARPRRRRRSAAGRPSIFSRSLTSDSSLRATWSASRRRFFGSSTFISS